MNNIQESQISKINMTMQASSFDLRGQDDGKQKKALQNFSDSNQVINDYLFCLDNNQRQIKAAQKSKMA